MATRLRKAFRYPSEGDEDDPDELDEEHQEKLIADLQIEDARKNDLYRKAFLAVPLICALYFLYDFVTARTARHRLIAILSISSLSCTAYNLYFMPIEAPDHKGKRQVYQVEAAKSPIEKFLPRLNATLIGVVQLAAVLSWWRGNIGDAWMQTMPTLVFGLTMYVRQQLAPLDLEELQRARYELKGA